MLQEGQWKVSAQTEGKGPQQNTSVPAYVPLTRSSRVEDCMTGMRCTHPYGRACPAPAGRSPRAGGAAIEGRQVGSQPPKAGYERNGEGTKAEALQKTTEGHRIRRNRPPSDRCIPSIARAARLAFVALLNANPGAESP